jgi:hypothetical protein
MSDSIKVESVLSSLPEPLECTPEDLPITVVLEPDPPTLPFSTPSHDQGLFEKLFSPSPRAWSGSTKLFSPAGPATVNLSANPTSIYFGRVNVFGTVSRSFSVINFGNSSALLSLSASFPFNVGGGRTIKPGSSAYFTVNFNPSQAGTFSGYVSGTYGISVALSGTAVDPYKK